ncbi:aliphatic aldoxime dehydratase [Rhodococcus sp. NPDC003322]
MESAISEHLRCPRTLSRRVPDSYEPAFPLWVGRHDHTLQQVAMGFFGVQFRGEESRAKALSALRQIVTTFGIEDGPLNYDLTHHVDAEGYENLMAAGYWRDNAAYDRWARCSEVANWWESEDRLTDGLGFFRETLKPRDEQIETLYTFQDSVPPGVGSVMDSISGDIMEHGYWGSMRDRIPVSQTDWMEPSGALKVVAGDPAWGGRVTIQGHDNLTLIRSGQDWSETVGDERSLYLDKLQPVLVAGMDFLRDNGPEVGCYSNRFVRNIDLDGEFLDVTYNLGHWTGLDKLERWSESHATHLRIFSDFVKIATDLGNLRFHHEVSVFDAGDQCYEYINCHPQTGMLRDAALLTP